MPAKQKASSSSPAPASRNRDQARVVRRYLASLEAERKGGRRRLSDSISNRILKIDELLVTADPLSRLHLTQERIDLHGEQIRYGNGVSDDVSSLEKLFIRVARSYADRLGISYAAWRQVGVHPDVLERAGIVRTALPRSSAPLAGDAPADQGPDAAAEQLREMPVGVSVPPPDLT
jgi:hypothetical protein